MSAKIILKKIVAVILFTISFLFLISVIAIIAVPDAEGMKAAMVIVLSLFCIVPLFLGIKLLRSKNKSAPKQNKTSVIPHIDIKETEQIPADIPIEDMAMREVSKQKKDNFSEIILYYKDASSNVSARRISNVSPEIKDGVKYIRAFCHIRNAVRTFRLDRVEKLFLNGSESNINEFYNMMIKGVL